MIRGRRLEEDASDWLDALDARFAAEETEGWRTPAKRTEREYAARLARAAVRELRYRIAEFDDAVDASAVERPQSCPTRGEVPAFDAGWDAHETGLERETVAILTPPSGRAWALMGWDARNGLTTTGPDSREGE